LQWATTDLKNTGQTTGPTLLYSKNVPWGDSLDSYYLANTGVAQTLYNEEEDFDLWLAQVGRAPTEVTLSRLETSVQNGSVIVKWETTSEIDNLGFNLYRSASTNGARTKLNSTLIPSLVPPGSPFGAAYEYADTGVAPGMVYYWLEGLDIYGHTEIYGPVEAQVALHTLHVGPIRIRYELSRIGPIIMSSRAADGYTVTAELTVLDSAAQPVDAARVAARWSLPDQGARNGIAWSDENGVASFSISGMPSGAYEFCVTGLIRPGWVYDPAQNTETCETLIIP